MSTLSLPLLHGSTTATRWTTGHTAAERRDGPRRRIARCSLGTGSLGVVLCFGSMDSLTSCSLKTWGGAFGDISFSVLTLLLDHAGKYVSFVHSGTLQFRYRIH
ncbi:hypothetical protein BRADI_1g70785v3 [Brachypodium distachyon]|uniref:Uncharacterized protein n=1 Tax=Brachypodium distachyon TaxID=15368 RepID=A0A2K2DUI6_BRADI|nr:hypothetical protein BRADI_1g70785v3 [Brachypodium distachyon]